MSKIKAPVIQCLVRTLFLVHKWHPLTGVLTGMKELGGVSFIGVRISVYEFRGGHSVQSTAPCLKEYKHGWECSACLSGVGLSPPERGPASCFHIDLFSSLICEDISCIKMSTEPRLLLGTPKGFKEYVLEKMKF